MTKMMLLYALIVMSTMAIPIGLILKTSCDAIKKYKKESVAEMMNENGHIKRKGGNDG